MRMVQTPDINPESLSLMIPAGGYNYSKCEGDIDAITCLLHLSKELGKICRRVRIEVTSRKKSERSISGQRKGIGEVVAEKARGLST